MLNPLRTYGTDTNGSDIQMIEQYAWTAWFDGTLTTFIIIGLVVLNILMAWFAFNQKKRRSKLEHDVLSAETFSSAAPLAAKRPFEELSLSEINTGYAALEYNSLLKIDQAIKMVKSGLTLEEIKSALDIEVAYLQILAKHHRG